MPSRSRPEYPEEGELELHLWGGGWGLPSLDPESLQALAAIRFAGAPTSVKECNNPWKSPKGSIPFFKQANGEYAYSAHEIGLYLRSKNFSGDYGLTSRQCAETVAYTQMIWDGLHIAYQYFFWIHDGNYNEIVRPFYGRRLPWVYKLWYPERLRSQAKEVLISIYHDAEEQPQSVEPYVLDKAKKCVALISQKLGTNEFLMGTSSPTTIDAVAFSYLAAFWKVKLHHNPIKEFMATQHNLERYLTRISQRYFPVAPKGVQSSGSTIVYGDDGEVVEKTKDDGSLSAKQKIGGGLLVSIVMVLYALKNGILRLPSNMIEAAGHEDHTEEDDEDYWE